MPEHYRPSVTDKYDVLSQTRTLGAHRGTKGTVLFVPLNRAIGVRPLLYYLLFIWIKKRGTKRTVPFVPLCAPVRLIPSAGLG